MSDFEYLVKMMLQAVREGDVAALRALADRYGVDVTMRMDDFSLWKQDEYLKRRIYDQMRIPPSLL